MLGLHALSTAKANGAAKERLTFIFRVERLQGDEDENTILQSVGNYLAVDNR